MNLRALRVFVFILPLLLSISTMAAPSLEEQLEKAHVTFHDATNRAGFVQAASQYEALIEKGGVRNGHLYYTLGNSWFMAGDLGRAILNYRRAEPFLPRDADLKQNLATARAQRSDLIPARKHSPLANRLLGWHYHIPAPLRWWMFVLCWLAFWGAWFSLRRATHKESRLILTTTGLLSCILLGSLIAETLEKARHPEGVIIAPEILARKGNGTLYAPAFEHPMHSGTEFRLIEQRRDWQHIRLTDGQTCWIPAQTTAMINVLDEL